MNNETKINVIIPARAGSKGINNKNLSTVKGIPLYMRSVNHSLRLASRFDIKTWLSTDIKDIFMPETKKNNLHIHRRSKSLSGDSILTIDVVQDIIKTYMLDPEELILLFQPTSPYRSNKELIQAINKILENNYWNSAVSLTCVGGNHPFRMKRITKDNECIDYLDQGFEDMRPRQLLPNVYIRSGNFYLTTVHNCLKQNTLLPKPCLGIVHKEEYLSINIDKQIDLDLANIINFDDIY